MERCSICKKELSDALIVWYGSKEPEAILCKVHHKEWLKHHRPYIQSHKKIKTTTKRWSEMCQEESLLFLKWLKLARKEFEVKK